MLASTVAKIQERSPLKYSLARKLVSLDPQKMVSTPEELWSTLQFLLTLSDSQAAVERGFSVNKEVLAPNMQEMNLKAIRLVHSSVASLKIKTSDFTVTDKCLKSCSHASNNYKMYLMEKEAEKEKSDIGQKRKALQDELMAAKKKKTELESVASWLLDTANKKAKEEE